METKPFHKTIIEAIRQSTLTTNEIFHLFDLIKKTTIPENHDAIMAAIDHYFDFPGSQKFARDIRLVKENLLEQKRAALNNTGDFNMAICKSNIFAIKNIVQQLYLVFSTCSDFLVNKNQNKQDKFYSAIETLLRNFHKEITTKAYKDID